MRATVSVKTNARKNEVVKADDSTFRVAVTASPVGGKANRVVIALLAEYFGVPKSSLSIHSGRASRKKVIEIDQDVREEYSELQPVFKKEAARRYFLKDI